MWPLLLDMTKEESVQNLRNLELEAYSHLVSALRAQGPLNSDKRKLLKETSIVLNITQERHKAEVRRAISDEKLNTIAYHVTGHTESLEDWAQEGRRLVPLLPRTAPQTAFSALADEASETASQSNKQLPSPSCTERKRQIVPQLTNVTPETSKTSSFRIPDPPKVEDSKKRKLCPENSSLAQHLLAPKVCRIQQLYRQRSSKTKTKELHKKPDHEQLELIQQQHRVIQQVPQAIQQQATICPVPQKVNVLQNISLQSPKEEPLEQEDSSGSIKLSEQVPNIPICANENQAPRPKLISSIKPNTNIMIKQAPIQPPGPSNEVQKSIKMCSSKKPITKTVNSGQKLIVVSNAQTIPTNSILQRTLQIPFVKNVSIKNFEKFKIVTSNSATANIQVTNATNSAKHKVVTVKTNPTTKKVIPFSQLQVLNSKGSIKVLPLGGKIVGKTVTASSSPLYIMNAMGTSQAFTKSTSTSQLMTTPKSQGLDNIVENGSEVVEKVSKENGKSSVLADILKASGVISDDGVEDYDMKIEEFHISQNKNNSVEGECVEMETVKSEEDADVKTESVHNLEFAMLPMQVDKEEELHDINEESCDGKDENMSNEVIESETLQVKAEELNMMEELKEEEASVEDASHVIIETEVSRSSDIESN